MSIRRFIVTSVVCLLIAAPVFAKDYTGTWCTTANVAYAVPGVPVANCTFQGNSVITQLPNPGPLPIAITQVGALSLTAGAAGCPGSVNFNGTANMAVDDVLPNYPVNTGSVWVNDPLTASGNVNPATTAAAGPFNGTGPGGAVITGNWSSNRGACAAGPSVPTMTPWGMITFIVLLMLSAVYFLRRKGGDRS